MTAPALDDALRQRIFRYHRARLDNDADADDLTQRTLLRIARKHETLRDDERAEAWMMRIAKNALIDFYRARARRKNATARAAEEPEASITAPPDDQGEDDEALRLEMQTWIAPFIDTLDAPYAEALRLVELAGMTQAAAARHVGISLSGMKSRVQRGRQKLRATLQVCCDFDLDARGRPVAYRYKGETCACAEDGDAAAGHTDAHAEPTMGTPEAHGRTS